jgi:hypothetical protein
MQEKPMEKKKQVIVIWWLPILCLLLAGCAATATAQRSDPQSAGDSILGFGILKRLPGLWNGPVSTTTPAGSFDNWYVDFRPVSPAQVSQYSTLDADTLNYISFFIVKHDNQLKVAMRTEGVFQNKGCVTYEVIEAARESEGYYKFSDFQAGSKRAYTELKFKSDNEMIMETYTNKFNRVSPLEIHSRWSAKRGDDKAASAAVSHFKYPQPVMVKDFSDVFQHMSESIYFTFENDPYSSSSQPYVGSVTVNISMDSSLKVKSDDELFVLLTTESLFEGLKYDKENLKYISKYVYLPIGTKRHTFDNVHPGTYYLYSYNDINGDKRHLSGDYMSSKLDNQITLKPKGSVVADTHIDFVIP